jgi:hypothetical protein
MNLLKLKCVFCGKEFLRRKGQLNEAKKFGWKQYCSWECLSNNKIKRGVLLCENCGRPVERTLNQISPHNYCSQSCAAIANNKNRPEREAQLKICAECGREFRKSKGNLKYCSLKCRRNAGTKCTRDQLIDIIKLATQELKRTPAKREMRKIADMCVRSFGSWNNAIIAADLIPNRSHNQRMYKCINAKALDGHICDSVSELIIDNWLTKNKITHERNIPYPQTKHRADWGVNLNGQTIFVEYFGLAKDSPRYDRSVKNKKDICRKYKIKLIEIYPRNLYSKNSSLNENLKEKFRYFSNL